MASVQQAVGQLRATGGGGEEQAVAYQWQVYRQIQAHHIRKSMRLLRLRSHENVPSDILFSESEPFLTTNRFALRLER